MMVRPLDALRRFTSGLQDLARRVLGGEPLPATPKTYPWEHAYPPGIDWRVEIPPRPVFAILDDAVAKHGDRPAINFLGKSYAYREIGELVAKAASGFQKLGVRKGTKVGLFLPNSHYFVICYHAVLKAGGTVVNFNPLYAEREIERQIRDAGVEIMVTLNLTSLYPKIAGRVDDGTIDRVVVCSMSAALPLPQKALFAVLRRKEIADIPSDDQHVKFDTLTNNEGHPEPVEIDPVTDLAVLQYTGGTTGIPKGARLTHANLYINTMQVRLWAPDLKAGEEKILGVLPLFHVFGMTGVMNASLAVAAEMVLLPRFRLKEVLRIIDKERPTAFFGVPTIYSAINGHRHPGNYDLTSLKFCISGGAALPVEVKRKFEEMTGCTLVEGYGLTEAGPVCTINPIRGINKPGSAGMPIPGTHVSIISMEDPDQTLPLGEHGEVCITGPQVMAGYFRQEEETDAVLTDGRLRTGDVGYLDEDGYLFIVDRIKDLIITGGYNVYPRMIEEAIYLHPAVADAAVCGVPHPHHGEIVKAFVTLRPGENITAGQLRQFLKAELAPFEVPRRIEFLKKIPKTMIGKPLRRELVAREEKALEGNQSIATPTDDSDRQASPVDPGSKNGKDEA